VITIATIAVGFDIDVDRATRDRVATAAFDLAEQSAREFLPVGDLGVEAVVERGSVNVFVTVLVTVPALLTALADYGSAAEGFDRLKADIKAMKKYFVRELPQRAQLPEQAFETSRLTTTELTKIGRFIREVEIGALPPLEGAKKACTELEFWDAPLDSKTKKQLEKSFSSIAPKPRDRHRRSDAERAAGRVPEEALQPRRRLPRKPSGVDRVRIWRNPGESRPHREEISLGDSRPPRPNER
jgi:hypothetical protein